MRDDNGIPDDHGQQHDLDRSAQPGNERSFGHAGEEHETEPGLPRVGGDRSLHRAERVAIEGIEAAIREADAGLSVPHEEVVAWVRSWQTGEELPRPQPKAR
jgi:hypothetical protein